MNRRKAIKNLGLSLGTISLTPAVLSLLQSCQNDLDWNPVFFDSNQIKFISEITNLINADPIKPKPPVTKNFI